MEDATKIGQIMYISKFLRASQFILIISCTSYFTGMLWYMKCEMSYKADPHENFLASFNLKTMLNWDKAITMTYFMFTSLSTVGLGDYHPISNSERIIGAFIILFGVILTSFIMDMLSKMIIENKRLSGGFEQSN